jgi:polynucleotide 5'-hydroxyl-kinase GRC3/NOL9
LRVCAVVCGPKGAGKSTLTRLLVNTLQSATQRAVGLLDADCGAPEVTPPGVVSLSLLDRPLLGPPAARLGASDAPQPLECRFVGDTSPASDPAAYAAALDALLTAWSGAAGPAAPLVINTMGWVRGLGLELLAGLLRSCSPTHMLYIRAPGSSPDDRSAGVPKALFWALQADASAPPCRVLELAAPARSAPAEPGAAADGVHAPQRRSAADARALLWAAWAYAACEPAEAHSWAAMPSPGGAGEAAAFAFVAAALSAAKPYALPVASVRCRLLHGAVPASDAFRVLNGAIVAHVADDSAGSRCLGLGLVRSVDAAAGVLHLLTPLPPAVAASTTALVVGRLELPAALLAAPLHASPYLTSWALAPEGSGGAAMRSRNNLQRGGQAAQN